MLYNSTGEQQANWMHLFHIEDKWKTYLDEASQVSFSRIQVTISPLCSSL